MKWANVLSHLHDIVIEFKVVVLAQLLYIWIQVMFVLFWAQLVNMMVNRLPKLKNPELKYQPQFSVI